MQPYTHMVHPFEPVYDANSKILILGSFPSVKTRETGFYYGHPQNRFWKVIASVLNQKVPITNDEKRTFLINNRIAVWDSIYSCDIMGSSDSSIKNASPTDLRKIIENSQIQIVFCNGKMSGNVFDRYQRANLTIEKVTLPSTSPANAAFSLEKLCKSWMSVADALRGN